MRGPHATLLRACLLHAQGAGKGRSGGKGKENAGTAHNPDVGPSGRPPVPRAEVKLPLESGTLVSCCWRDNTYYPARVIASRPLVDGVPWDGVGTLPEDAEHEYYVHYRNLNRRMDEWVDLGKMDLDTVVPPEPIDLSDPK